RAALKIVGGVAATGALALVGCQQEAKAPDTKAPSAPAAPAPKKEAAPEPKAEPTAAAGDCGTEGIDDASKTMRTTLKYVEKSPEEGKVCSGCAQYKAPEGGAACGGCNLFTGPVNANGYCISYAPKAG
ncbi:MAG: high-potential iron-sulfur protein, partial [Myxococcota bacterium]